MTYTVVALRRRKEGTTPAQFRAYYDNTHVPLLRSLSGSLFPLSHTRHYVTRTQEATVVSAPKPPAEHANHDDNQDPPHPSHQIAAQAAQEETSTTAAGYVPVVYKGAADEINYDCITMMVWEDQAAFDRFKQVFYREEVHARVSEDERAFLDPDLRITYAIEEPAVTLRPS
ncbi:hypothetical protein PG985_003434 [Apiospora marii]|jgi:hypothetical protein|uniref:EthD domain-containing protein n=1 Tax=Apiospora marii TaxID=335849 RepID=A0ABR1RVJ3_9PEZI